MSSADNRRPAPQRQARPRREPLFPLEDDDIAPRARRGPPAPLGDLLGDLDEAIPTRSDGPRRTAARRPDPPPPAPRAAAERPERTERPSPQVTTSARPRPRPMVAAPPDDDLRAARARRDDTEMLLRQAEMLASRPYVGGGAPMPRVPQLPSLNRWAIMGVIALASLLVLLTLGGGGGSIMSHWGGLLNLPSDGATNRVQLFGATQAHPSGDYRLRGAPSLSPQQIDAILASYGSPATGTGSVWYNLGLQYGIDPAFPVAFFIHESAAGTAQGWAGLKGGGASTHNVGNIICAGYATCYGRFRDYASWDQGIEDWYRLIDVEYIQGRGTMTVQDIIPIYAPSFENDVQAYINSVNGLVDGWRTNGVK